MEKWEIRYYYNENSTVHAFKEEITGPRSYVVNWAKNRLKNSNFKSYDLTRK